jgi:hypothetical protein
MTAEYTIPALRDTAGKLRSDAAALLAAAEIEANKHVEQARQKAAKMRASADEIDADANAKEQRPSPQPIGPCAACGHPLVRDELGPRHADPAIGIGTDCPGPNPPVAAPPTMPFEQAPVTRTDGEVAQP